eukprot:4631467-Alexandrium_andersonii.AAC.1
MSASLVGSEMCIRDSSSGAAAGSTPPPSGERPPNRSSAEPWMNASEGPRSTSRNPHLSRSLPASKHSDCAALV